MTEPMPIASVEGAIHVLRGQRVILDADLARFFGVTTKRLNEALKRNSERFPRDFAFQLTRAEMSNLKSQIVTSNAEQAEEQGLTNLKSQIATSSVQSPEIQALAKYDPASISHGGRRKLPWAFTEHGVIMLASLLNSPVAIEASVRVVRAFVHLRELALNNRQLARRLDEIEKRVGEHDGHLDSLFEAIRQLLLPPKPSDKPEIGFHVRETPPSYRVRKKSTPR